MMLPGVTIDEDTHRLLDRRAVPEGRCRNACSWWAEAISASNWARSGAGWARGAVVEFLDRITPGLDGRGRQGNSSAYCKSKE